jgi:hypothetical protein
MGVVWLLAAILFAQEIPQIPPDIKVTLRVDYMTPQGHQNIWFSVLEPSVQVCLADAKEALERGVPQVIQDKYDVHAMSAMCVIPAAREHES